MVPWSVTMRSTLMFDCVLAMGLFTCIGAITVSIDRSDNKPPPTRPSMIANGWRPLTNAYEDTIGTNVSPSSSLERSGPLHPVLGKLQEHMAASEKLKPQRKGKPVSHHDYNPPSILGSFTVLGHAAAKARGEAQSTHKNNKHVASETRDYTFLIPPPKDAYRFDLDQHRKPILRDSSAFLRQPQFHQAPDPIKAATYFIKGYTSTTNSPSSPSTTKNRHAYDAPYVPQLLQPPRYHVKPFESLKVSANPKPYFQLPGTGPANDFGKDKRLSDHRQNFDKFQGHNEHGSISPAGNFFGQVNHPGHGYKTSFERDPAFLVHESHEISYITPPSVYNPFNFRPSLPYETLLPPDVYSSSTTAPTTPRTVQESNKYRQQVTGDADLKRPVQVSATGSKQNVETGVAQEVVPTAGFGNTYYVSESQDLTPPPSAWPIPKSKYPSDINEVLPRVNPPSKFNQEVNIASNQIPQAPKVVFIGPQTQQPQFQTPVLPIDIRPLNGELEYETPESISLKHFNEQQYLIQQQLLHRDRQRLAEQERQQQLEIEKQQQEELKRRQQELRQLLERQKQEEKEEEEARLAVESARNQTEKLAKVTEEEEEGQPPRTIQLAGYEITNVSTDEAAAAAITEESSVGEQPKVQQSQVTQPEPHVFQDRPTDHPQDISKKNQADQANYREQQAADLRPQRPHKPSRDQYRRRKPSTAVYEPTPPTETPLQVPEISSVPVTLRGEEVGSRTTAAPETVTLAAQPRPRTRRPGAPLRRRRPTTTAPPEPAATEPSTPEDFLKYEKQEEETPRQVDVAKKRRIKPVATQPSLEEVGVTEKKTNIRKRPGHRNRVNPGEPFEAEIVTEIVHAPLSTYKSPTESVQSYTIANEYDQLATNGQPNQQFDYTESQRVATVEEKQRGGDSITPSVPFEYQTESSRTKPHEDPNNLVTYNPGPSVESVATNIPLEDLFVRTEGNYLDRGTVSSTSQGNVATTASPPTTSPSTQPPPLSTSSARSTHKIRPIRYGNATRPRFSIKDYKSRMDYKSRLAQISSTEPPAPSKQRGGSPSFKSQHSQQQQSGGEGGRETTGRYKYVSRVNYRTSSPNPPPKDQQEYATEEGTSSATSTERSNRFVPKRRPVNGNVYRSRVSNAAPNRNHYDTDTSVLQSRPSTARPENVFSSSVRRRPVMKGRLTPHQSSTAPYPEARDAEGTEMAAEETSFYSAVTTMGAGSEVGEKEGGASDSTTSVATTSTTDEAGRKEEEEIESEITVGTGYHSRGGVENGGKVVVEEPVVVVTEKSVDESQLRESWGITEQYSTARVEETTEIGGKGVAESTTKFEIPSEEEELFAKASQSVADLTSSASALYDKPGMFKAVSPESRIAASHFKIPTDEPTLPIEAFFQELSRKS